MIAFLSPSGGLSELVGGKFGKRAFGVSFSGDFRDCSSGNFVDLRSGCIEKAGVNNITSTSKFD